MNFSLEGMNQLWSRVDADSDCRRAQERQRRAFLDSDFDNRFGSQPAVQPIEPHQVIVAGHLDGCEAKLSARHIGIHNQCPFEIHCRHFRVAKYAVGVAERNIGFSSLLGWQNVAGNGIACQERKETFRFRLLGCMFADQAREFAGGLKAVMQKLSVQQINQFSDSLMCRPFVAPADPKTRSELFAQRFVSEPGAWINSSTNQVREYGWRQSADVSG